MPAGILYFREKDAPNVHFNIKNNIYINFFKIPFKNITKTFTWAKRLA